jgi:hypothetical protein
MKENRQISSVQTDHVRFAQPSEQLAHSFCPQECLAAVYLNMRHTVTMALGPAGAQHVLNFEQLVLSVRSADDAPPRSFEPPGEFFVGQRRVEFHGLAVGRSPLRLVALVGEQPGVEQPDPWRGRVILQERLDQHDRLVVLPQGVEGVGQPRLEVRVLCNCEVLTTGFDAPRVTHVVMARPTVSQVLYEQMVGRGLRGARFGGTETCVILDCEDDFSGPTRPELGYKAFRRVWRQETKEHQANG